MGLWQGPSFVGNLRPARNLIEDFFQDWASGRLYQDGLPVYMSQEAALERYLGYHRRPDEPVWNEVNAHPPTSILLYIPLAGLDYPDALLAWNFLTLVLLVASLGLVIRQLAMPFAVWSLLPLVSVLLICCPLREQLLSGQPNMILLLLILGAWAADRSEHPGWAGMLLGTAAAIKLFPGLLFVYFLCQRRWKTVVSGVACVLALTFVTMLVLGPQTYREYVVDVLPQVAVYRSSWGNGSVAAFWSRLFDPAARSGNVLPFMHRPDLAHSGIALCCVALVAVLAWVSYRARSRTECDHAFALGVTTMLLVSPITWNHYFVMLCLPVVLLWAGLPLASRLERVSFWVTVGVLWMPPDVGWFLFMGVPVGMWMKSVATPWQSLTVLSLQLYAILGLFVLGVRAGRQWPGQSARLTVAGRLGDDPEQQSTPYPLTESPERKSA
jgi:alpha-1,2-mannosyltransferase